MKTLYVSAAAFALLLGAAEAGDLTFTPYHADGRYAAGETVGWTVALAPSAQTTKGSYSYTVIENEKRDLKRGSIDLSSGNAKIEVPAGHAGRLRVVVDYLAPPPPTPPSPAQLKEINAAIRALVLKSDPSLQDVLDKYPDYQFVRPAFDFRTLQEDRVATLNAAVAGPSAQ
jgi:hypothetical protein